MLFFLFEIRFLTIRQHIQHIIPVFFHYIIFSRILNTRNKMFCLSYSTFLHNSIICRNLRTINCTPVLKRLFYLYWIPLKCQLPLRISFCVRSSDSLYLGYICPPSIRLHTFSLTHVAMVKGFKLRSAAMEYSVFLDIRRKIHLLAFCYSARIFIFTAV
ncbi:hypothetical protein EVA_05873 [gut metagenome]|uniref:Uncharacterized protein n=1 Tax=gut metagenome TaxID=749906 RepID=J9GGF3_9ZZZZ